MNIGLLAPWYRWIEYAVYGRALERRRFAYLHRLEKSRRILILGEGDGRALARVLAVAPEAEIDVIDSSPEMIALAARRAGHSPRVHFQVADALDASLAPAAYDAILTLFFLDCFSTPQVRSMIRNLLPSLTPKGLWLMTDFAIPDSGWRRAHARIWIWVMYRFFGLTTGLRVRKLPPIARLLEEAGLECLANEDERGRMIRSEIWARAAH